MGKGMEGPKEDRRGREGVEQPDLTVVSIRQTCIA